MEKYFPELLEWEKLKAERIPYEERIALEKRQYLLANFPGDLSSRYENMEFLWLWFPKFDIAKLKEIQRARRKYDWYKSSRTVKNVSSLDSTELIRWGEKKIIDKVKKYFRWI